MKVQTNEERDIKLAIIDERTKVINSKVDDINKKLESSYVTQDQFDPIRRIVYGVVGVVLASFLLALLALVIRK